MKRIFRFDQAKDIYLPEYSTTVFTNGCFDILHSGHIEYLQKAKNLGDILIIGLNSDTSVKKLKGQKRPINNENDRALILSNLRFVDYVIIFPQQTPVELIKIIKPDIHVKGGDYKIEDLPETEILNKIQAEIKIIPLKQGYSTTGLIESIKTLYD